MEGESSAASIKAKQKKYQPPAGITNFVQLLPKDTTQASSNRTLNAPGDEANENVEPKKSSWTDWKPVSVRSSETKISPSNERIF